jgi:hypothetical protein
MSQVKRKLKHHSWMAKVSDSVKSQFEKKKMPPPNHWEVLVHFACEGVPLNNNKWSRSTHHLLETFQREFARNPDGTLEVMYRSRQAMKKLLGKINDAGKLRSFILSKQLLVREGKFNPALHMGGSCEVSGYRPG